MVLLLGPTSTTCAPVGAIKRASDVPPLVDNSVVNPVTCLMASLTASVILVRNLHHAYSVPLRLV